jgi:hypothetical protein
LNVHAKGVIHRHLKPSNVFLLSVEAVLRRALSRRRSARYPSVGAFARAFSRASTRG